ncbi:hypothetical protein MMC25_003506 [Agyrium rufum]|nr:hypothetical protein [Agyrium rufum]
MAATVTQSMPSDMKPAIVDVPPPTSPRKRRRRAPTTGAADDCFACQDLHTSCDRRRPYCTQCLDRGKDCSGYKTVLTWGVGVASRGKLRGLALPIAMSRKVEPDEDAPPKSVKKRSTGSQSKGGQQKNGDNVRIKQEPGHEEKTSKSRSSSTLQPPLTTTFGFVNVDPNAPHSASIPSTADFQWQPPQAASHRRVTSEMQGPSPKRHLRRHSLEHLHIPIAPLPNYGPIPLTAGVYNTYPNPSFTNTIDSSSVGQGFGVYEHNMLPMYKEFQPQPMMSRSGEGSFFPNSLPGHWASPEHMNPPLPSEHPSRASFREGENFYTDPELSSTFDHILTGQTQQQVSQEMSSTGDEDVEDIGRGSDSLTMSQPFTANSTDYSMMLMRQMSASKLGNTPQLQFYINYYDKVISPVIVAFDGPTNPYRCHILNLATRSETLQHAIAALSASNIRLRRQQSDAGTEQRLLQENPHDNTVRKSSIAHNELLNELSHSPDVSVPEAGMPSVEELYHKSESIRSLNMQLADPSRRKDDSILATLLVLCLYHICDTGIAKFRTQFAGVKKILALRGELNSKSKRTQWLTTMFMWFDAMTATVNDREGQFSSTMDSPTEPSLDAFRFSGDQDEWVLENLAGCDGRLFKIISQLGRLNLLSQNKPVSPLPSKSTPVTTKTPTPKASPHPRTAEYYSMNHNRFDGNGFGTLLAEEDLYVNQPDYYQTPPIISPTTFPPPDSRYQFWNEWSDIRHRLTTWTPVSDDLPNSMGGHSSLNPFALESSHAGLSTQGTPTPGETTYPSDVSCNRVDVNHISESFRYSALLYIERLAYPDLPSSSQNIQFLVNSSLRHIKLVRSDVYLLWPLFITGTECVNEEDRDVIRNRCLDIQKDSGFFNNISGLSLLEKVWARDRERSERAARTGGAGKGGGDEELAAENEKREAGEAHLTADGRGAAMGAVKGRNAFRWREVMGTVDGEYIVI